MARVIGLVSASWFVSEWHSKVTLVASVNLCKNTDRSTIFAETRDHLRYTVYL